MVFVIIHHNLFWISYKHDWNCISGCTFFYNSKYRMSAIQPIWTVIISSLKVRITLNSGHQIDEFSLFHSSQVSVIDLSYYYILYG